AAGAAPAPRVTPFATSGVNCATHHRRRVGGRAPARNNGPTTTQGDPMPQLAVSRTAWPWALLVAVALGAGAANAVPTSTRFEPSLDVQGTKLQLNGAGVRYRAIFKVYELALYTTKKVTTSAELLA